MRVRICSGDVRCEIDAVDRDVALRFALALWWLATENDELSLGQVIETAVLKQQRFAQTRWHSTYNVLDEIGMEGSSDE